MNKESLDLNAYALRRIREVILELGSESGTDLSGVTLPIDRPKDPKHGDLGLATFPLAKILKKNPKDLAEDLARRFAGDPKIEQANAIGAFVNLRYSRSELAESVLRGILEDRAPYGRWPAVHKSIVIDFSSPNIAKPFHIGHLRSTVIGAALRRIYLHTGHEVHGINHLGDWGAQFGKIIVAFRRWGDEEALRRNPMRHLFDIYVRYNREEKELSGLKEEAALAFRELESGEDNEERKLWRRLRELSLRAFEGPYSRLAVEFDHVTGESFYEDKMEATINEIVQAGISTVSDGALVVELEEESLPPCILRKSDGTTIYATRDLAALFYRREAYKFDKALYVVGSEQRLHFRQLKLVLKKLDWPGWESVEHVDFGMILFKDEESGRWKKGKARDGSAIFLDEVLDEAVAGVRKIIEEKNPKLANKEAVAEQIGVSAIIFNDLTHGRVKDIKFDWNAMLSFEGETGPYVQFAGARLASILRKAGDFDESAAVAYECLADAELVLLTMQEFGPTLQRVIDKNEPSLLTGLMIRTASTIHSYLRDHHVLSAEGPVRQARLALVAAGRKLLRNGLALLGVASPEEM